MSSPSSSTGDQSKPKAKIPRRAATSSPSSSTGDRPQPEAKFDLARFPDPLSSVARPASHGWRGGRFLTELGELTPGEWNALRKGWFVADDLPDICAIEKAGPEAPNPLERAPRLWWLLNHLLFYHRAGFKRCHPNGATISAVALLLCGRTVHYVFEGDLEMPKMSTWSPMELAECTLELAEIVTAMFLHLWPMRGTLPHGESTVFELFKQLQLFYDIMTQVLTPQGYDRPPLTTHYVTVFDPNADKSDK